MRGELSLRQNVKLASATAVAAQIRVKERLHAGGVIAGGYHFCQACYRVTENIGEEVLQKCCWCGSHKLKYMPKI